MMKSKVATMIAMVMMVAMMSVSVANAIDERVNGIYIADVETYYYPEKAGLSIILGSMDDELCPLYTPAVTISIEVWPDVYVDEILGEAPGWDCNEWYKWQNYGEPVSNSSEYAWQSVGGDEVIFAFADDMEMYLKYGTRTMREWNNEGMFGKYFFYEVDAIAEYVKHNNPFVLEQGPGLLTEKMRVFIPVINGGAW